MTCPAARNGGCLAHDSNKVSKMLSLGETSHLLHASKYDLCPESMKLAKH